MRRFSRVFAPQPKRYIELSIEHPRPAARRFPEAEAHRPAAPEADFQAIPRAKIHPRHHLLLPRRPLRRKISSDFRANRVLHLSMRNWPLMTPRVLFALLIPISYAVAQATSAPSEGIASEWDVKARMTAMAEDVARIEDLLARVRPNEWIEKGAPDAYLRQLESSKASTQALLAA